MTETAGRTGEVFIDAFDRGVITTMGGVLNTVGDAYVIKSVSGIEYPPGYEGVPVFFAYPDDIVDNRILPSVVVRRDSISAAMSRWHPGISEYRIPAVGAHPVTVTNPRTGNVIASGYDAYESKSQAVPYDIVYTIQIRARYRNNLSGGGQKLLRYVMRYYQPYCRVLVVDSLETTRTYDAFLESPNAVDMQADVEGRETNWNLTLRVEAELDINDPVDSRALTSPPVVSYAIK